MLDLVLTTYHYITSCTVGVFSLAVHDGLRTIVDRIKWAEGSSMFIINRFRSRAMVKYLLVTCKGEIHGR